jgi:hypothetical protein
MADRVDARVRDVEALHGDAMVDGVGPDSEREELPASDPPMLKLRERRDHRIHPPRWRSTAR